MTTNPLNNPILIQIKCIIYLTCYLEVTSSYFFPSEKLSSDIINSSKQLNVSVLLKKQREYMNKSLLLMCHVVYV